MNHVERFRAVMNFQPVDRLPRWEWAMWWDQTIDRWHNEGLPRELKFSQVIDISDHFGLDPYQQFWFSTTDPTIEATQHHVAGIVANMDDYRRIWPDLFPSHATAIKSLAAWDERQRRGEAVGWCKTNNEYGEAEFVVNTIMSLKHRENLSSGDFAIFYRTNAQSRVFEDRLRKENIPYRVVGVPLFL